MSSDTTTFATHVAGGDITETWGNYVQNRHPFSYTIFYDAGSGEYYAYPGTSGGTVYHDANAMTVLDYCVQEHTTVYLKYPFSATGTLTIDVDDFSIISDIINSRVGTETYTDRAYIESITLQPTATNTYLSGVNLQGIAYGQMTWNAVQNGIYYCTLRDCLQINSTSLHGMIFQGTSVTNYVTSYNHYFRNYDTTADYGAITIKNGASIGEIYFIRPDYAPRANNVTFFEVNGGGACGPTVAFDYLSYYCNYTGCKLFNLTFHATDVTRAEHMVFNAPWLELHQTTTLFTINTAADGGYVRIYLNTPQLSIAGGTTATLLYNDKNFTSTGNIFQVRGGAATGTGTFTLGATLNQDAEFLIDVTGLRNYNPQAASTPAVGASPVTFGPYPYPAMIGVGGGDITSVTIRTQATGQTGAGTLQYYLLHPGDTCIIVYAGAPTVYLYPL